MSRLRDAPDTGDRRGQNVQPDPTTMLELIGLRVIEADWLRGAEAVLLREQAALLILPSADLSEAADWALAQATSHLAESLTR